MSSEIFRVQTTNRYSSFLDDEDSDDAKLNVKTAPKKNKKKSKKRENVAKHKSEVKQHANLVVVEIQSATVSSDEIIIAGTGTATTIAVIESNDKQINEIEIIAADEVDKCSDDNEKAANISPVNGINWYDMLEEEDDDDYDVMVDEEKPVLLTEMEPVESVDNGLTLNIEKLEITNDDNGNEPCQTLDVSIDVDGEWTCYTNRHFHNRDRNANKPAHRSTIDKPNNIVKNGIRILSRQKNPHGHANDVDRPRQFRHDVRNVIHGQLEKPVTSIGGARRTHHQASTLMPLSSSSSVSVSASQASSSQFANNRQRHGVSNSAKMAIKQHSRDSHVSIQQQQRAKPHSNGGDGGGRFVSNDSNGRLGGNAVNGSRNGGAVGIAGNGNNNSFWRTKERAHGAGGEASTVQQSYANATNGIDNNWRSNRKMVENL